jgi:phenylalanyl-tRNA synthetase beta chain
MKFTLAWLKTHLQTEAELSQIVETLTSLGLEVESVSDRGAKLLPFVAARVLSAEAHPNADRLKVCKVDAGAGIGGAVQVVCGAPNARAGMIGVFAAVGTTIPDGTKLKAASIRGIESQGMLVSMREMGLSEDGAGIIELPADAKIGQPFASILGIDDPVIELNLTPNRGDCLGVRGLARDLAAAGLGTLAPLTANPVKGAFQSPVQVHLDFPEDAADACPLFLLRTLRGVKNGPSPGWLSRRLDAIGLRPISALVDVTNFIAYDLGRPLHVFDADAVAGDLTVRLSRPGESLRALDGKDYQLPAGVTVIADQDGVLSLGGVMGGEGSGCTLETVNVYLESALFDPGRTARTGQRLNIQSDARQRFERGVDAALVSEGLERATRLLLEICGGVASEAFVAGKTQAPRPAIHFRPHRVHGLGGVDVTEDRSTALLQSLGFTLSPSPLASRKGGFAVTRPSWRNDIEGEADLVEEVMRLHGFENIPVVKLPALRAVPSPALSAPQVNRVIARRKLAARGLVEAVTYSFISNDHALAFGGGIAALRLVNPISADTDTMRPSLIPGLVSAAKRNFDHGIRDIALFEVGPAYGDDTPQGQSVEAAGVRRGQNGPRHWAGAARSVDLFDAKADAVSVLAALGIAASRLTTVVEAAPWYHPGRSGSLKIGRDLVLAQFGQLHPKVLQQMDLKEPAVGFEIFLDRIPERAGAARLPLKISEFPAVERDFAFVVDAQTAADDIVRAALGADRALIAEVAVFDVFEGASLGAVKKSVAISVRIEPREKTLTDAEIEAIGRKVVQAVKAATGATLRA